ncbi:hypothetical protein GBAR_LOCUS14687 [Geodia barretti]|uniref:Uncharacterized protein n=1 Tax=Geodia barretti TaxID=519541 RepID=A0AA35RRU0_GEOBA|nr:hypothetical protein GBAR_LOCUS9450 [Geodia barretti]CAI8025412.1 hypothetical protein GBAR_LOCUS14687 [Geodia barretti]
MQVRQRMPLFLPGKIIHITRDSPTEGCCGVCRRRPIRALWTAQSEFSELVMEKNMIRDHDMYYVQKMLLKLQKQEKLHRK